MRNIRIQIILLVIGVISLGCEYKFPEPIPPDALDPGNANFSNILILGGDLGSGFMDGALYSASQGNSVGAILVRQINLNNVNPIVFQQPDINSEVGYNLLASETEVNGKSYMKFIAPGEPQVFKDTNPGELPEVYSGPSLNNFSVPFLRTHQVLQPELSDNPFYSRFATTPGVSVLIDEVIASQPTMAIVQLGWQDILPYAMAGLTGNTDPDPNAITPLDLFESSYQEIVDLMLQNSEADMVLVNIPDVSKFPFFQAISNRAFLNGQEVGFLSNYYREYNIQVSKSNVNQDIFRPIIKFFSDDPPHLWLTVVDDPALVDRIQEDGSPLPKWRQMVDQEYILWSTPVLPTLENEIGTTQPLPKTFFFTPADVERIGDLVEQYNEVIATIAASNGRLHLFDWYGISEPWTSEGVTFDGVLHTYDFNRSGMFSSDGTNLNSRGSALFTDQLIEYINLQFGSNIPLVDVNSFPGNVFVNDF
jgi:hypothetical protein